jgi:hypothetical protein
VEIKDLKTGELNNSPTLYVGTYINSDVTEKLYSYQFIVYDTNDEIYDTSGELIHNTSTDENATGVGVKTTV